MAKLTDKDSLSAAPATGDLLHIVDISDTTADANGTSKKITVSNFQTGVAKLASENTFTEDQRINDGNCGILNLGDAGLWQIKGVCGTGHLILQHIGGGSNQFILRSDGRLGLGVTPDTSIQVKTGYLSYGEQLDLDGTSVSDGTRWQFISTGGDATEGDGLLVIKNFDGVTGTTILTSNEDGDVGIGSGFTDDSGIKPIATELHVNGVITFSEKSADPSNPSEGEAVLWMSDGTGTGSDGDVLIKVTAGGSSSTINLTEASTNASNAISDVVDDTTPQLGGQLDVNGNSLGDGTNELLKFTETASAVNELTVKNNSTGNAPELQATGNDSNIDLQLTPKGTGSVVVTGGIYAYRPIVSVTGTTKTLALSDANTKQVGNNASTQTFTVPTNASVAYPIGTEIEFIQKGAGTVTITGDTGVTVNGTSAGSVSVQTQYQGAIALKEAADNWIVSGNI